MKGSAMEIRPTKSPYGYLIVMLGMVVLLKLGILKQILGGWVGFAFPFVLCLMGATYGYKDLKPYLQWKGSTGDKLYMVLCCWILSGAACTVVWWLLGSMDAQNLRGLVIPLESWPIQTIDCILTGIGEECFKFMLMVALYTLLLQLGLGQKLSVGLAIIMVSLFFGALHLNYNPPMAAAITLGIGLGAVVEFYFLFKFQSIIPLMIAHAWQDVSVISCKLEEFGPLINGVIDMAIPILLIFMCCWSIKDTVVMLCRRVRR